jgi:formate dehydrogenase alpha subunit
VAGLAAAFGNGAMTNAIGDIETADCILVTGSNPTENHPVIGAAIKRAVTHRGAKLIVVDPRKIELADYATLWLSQKPGTDVAWMNGLMRVIIQEGRMDEAFVRERTEGFAELKASLETYTPAYVSAITGIPEKKIIEAARLFAGAKTSSVVYAMGITQHINGTDAVKALANLTMLCGQVGIPRAGLNPLRGQNNVQGACDMGGLPNVLPGYQAVTDKTLVAKFAEAWGVPGLSEQPGLTVVEIMRAAKKKDVRGLYIMGENPALSDADTNHVLESLQSLDFLVVQDIFLTETAKLAHLVLPGISFAEKEGTFTNTERRVQRVRRAIQPIGKAKADWEIISEISSRMGYPMKYEKAEDIFDEMRALTPSYAGLTYERLEENGLQWPCPAPDHPGTPYLHKGKFSRGLGKFHVIEHAGPAETPDAEFPLVLTTGRILYHYHTSTMTGKTRGLNELASECLVEICPADAENMGIQDEERVRVTSRRGEILAKAKVSSRSPQGCIFIPFHFAEAAANRLTHSFALDPVSKIPELKVCAVKIQKI